MEYLGGTEPVSVPAVGMGTPWSDGCVSWEGAGGRGGGRDKVFHEGYHEVWHKVSDCVMYSWRGSQDWSLWDWIASLLYSARKPAQNGGEEGPD